MNNMLELNQYMKLKKIPYIIYSDIKSLIKKKTDNSKNNPEKSLAAKIRKHVPCGYLMSTIVTFIVALVI